MLWPLASDIFFSFFRIGVFIYQLPSALPSSLALISISLSLPPYLFHFLFPFLSPFPFLPLVTLAQNAYRQQMITWLRVPDSERFTELSLFLNVAAGLALHQQHFCKSWVYFSLSLRFLAAKEKCNKSIKRENNFSLSYFDPCLPRWAPLQDGKKILYHKNCRP